MSVSISCHHCKLLLKFKHVGSNCIICSECGNINRTGGSASDYLIPFSLSLEDMSPLKIGSIGIIEEKSFIITGRVRYDFDNAFRNQWSVIFSDNTRGWLSECYGNYAYYRKTNIDVSANEFGHIKAGSIVELKDKREFIVETIRKNKTFSGEGELHEFISLPYDHFQIELSNESGDMFIVNILNKSSFEYFTGRYFEFDELKIQNYRHSELWK